MKDPQEMNSQELKELISNAGASVPSEGRDVDLVRMEQADQRTEQYNDLTVEQQMKFHDLPVPEDESERQGRFVQAYAADMADLQDRYGGEPVAQFEKDFTSGRFKAPPGLEKSENPHEVAFLSWLAQHANEFDSDYLGAVLPRRDDMGDLEDEEKTFPLRSRSADILKPERVRPPRQRKAEQTVKLPDLSTSDMQEMLSDWAKKHPERF
jgi:hypothetical protein